jgi:aspartyl/asparaginyl beta-hydroxylase (cupin superfamily)
MMILSILFWALIALTALVLITYLIEPASLAIFYSLLQAIFVKNPPFLDKEKIMPKHHLLKDNWETIRQELQVVLAHHMQDIPRFHEIDNIQRFISAKDEVPWRIFMLKAYDNWVAENTQLTPRTTELLRQIPEIKSAMFSILEPGKHIPYHRGFYKGVYRYHLGLIVPKEGECLIINGGQKYYWEEGEDVLFDDTYRHAVWNNTEETRVVLFCDVLRTDLPPWLQRMNNAVYQIRQNSQRLKKGVKRSQLDQKPQLQGK